MLRGCFVFLLVSLLLCWISAIMYRKLVCCFVNWQLPNPIHWQRDAVHLRDLTTAPRVQRLGDAKWCVLILHLLKPNRAPTIVQEMCTIPASAQTKQGWEDQPSLKRKPSPTAPSLCKMIFPLSGSVSWTSLCTSLNCFCTVVSLIRANKGFYILGYIGSGSQIGLQEIKS